MHSQEPSAILKRINHKLETDNSAGKVMKVRKARSEKHKQEVGEYYLVEVYTNVLYEKDVDIHTLAKKLGV